MTISARSTRPVIRMNDTAESQPTSITAGVLSYLVPGLGQIFQGRVLKGVMFLVILLGLFTVGHAMGNGQNVYLPPPEGQPTNVAGALYNSVYQRLPFAGQFWIGIAAWPAILQFFDVPVENAYPPLKTYMRAPRTREEEERVNDFIRNSDKMPDLGLIYTIIAGVLNILVIYDAYAGPAFLPPKKKEAPAV